MSAVAVSAEFAFEPRRARAPPIGAGPRFHLPRGRGRDRRESARPALLATREGPIGQDRLGRPTPRKVYTQVVCDCCVFRGYKLFPAPTGSGLILRPLSFLKGIDFFGAHRGGRPGARAFGGRRECPGPCIREVAKDFDSASGLAERFPWPLFRHGASGIHTPRWGDLHCRWHWRALRGWTALCQTNKVCDVFVGRL